MADLRIISPTGEIEVYPLSTTPHEQTAIAVEVGFNTYYARKCVTYNGYLEATLGTNTYIQRTKTCPTCNSYNDCPTCDGCNSCNTCLGCVGCQLCNSGCDTVCNSRCYDCQSCNTGCDTVCNTRC